MTAIDKLRQLGTAWEQRPELIHQARKDGATWQEIADALHMTRQGVVKLYATLDTKEDPS